jgi:DNA polymerase-3 subunit epsilon
MQDCSESFVVVDVETANPSLSSICQIGIASFRDGALQNSWGSLVNPEDYFDPFHISIHGIDETSVKSAPTWPVVYPQVDELLSGSIVVSHTLFDYTAMHRACEKYALTAGEYRWLDSARVVRLAWPTFASSGYGLSHVAEHFSIKYKEHDAREDARCAGEILLRAIAKTGWNPSEWLLRTKEPITSSTTAHVKHSAMRIGRPEGPLHGGVLVFTGVLSMPRNEAADVASAAGCEVDSSVTKRTTLLVVGDQDIRTKLLGHEKSSKHHKAEELITKGQRIRIIGETDFRHLCGLSLRRADASRTAPSRDINRKGKRAEGAMFCGKCGKPVDPADNFCRNCGTSAGYGAAPIQARPAQPPGRVTSKSTDLAKLGAVIFVVSLFGACPAVFVSGGEWIWALVLAGMVAGAVMYFAGS